VLDSQKVLGILRRDCLQMPRHKRVNHGDVARTALKKARSDSLPHVQRLFEENDKNVEEGSDGKVYNSNIFRRL
jgi:hypothetical protein